MLDSGNIQKRRYIYTHSDSVIHLYHRDVLAISQSRDSDVLALSQSRDSDVLALSQSRDKADTTILSQLLVGDILALSQLCDSADTSQCYKCIIQNFRSDVVIDFNIN